MSRVFTAQVPRSGDPAAALLIEDRWRWGGLLFPVLWALWNRHWLAALALLAAAAAIGALGAAGQAGLALAAEAALRLGVAMEGAALARLDRRMRGWREAGAVEAADADAAEIAWAAMAARGPAPHEAQGRLVPAVARGGPWAR